MRNAVEEYRKVYEMLEDEESRDIYLKKLNWEISGDWKYIDAIVEAWLPEEAMRNRRDRTEEVKNLMPRDRKIVFYGAGDIGQRILPFWENDERLIGFCCREKEKQKNGCLGWPVMSPEELLARKDLTVFITASRCHDEIKAVLENNGYPQDQIYSWTDYNYEDRGQYFEPEFMTYEEEEVFVDAGCFDMYSTLDLKKYCKCLKKVYAFEPDPENHKVCEKRKRQYKLDEVELLPYGAWSEKTTLRFQEKAWGCSGFREEGQYCVPVVTIDEVTAAEERVTFIKMDIEGSELEALKGAKNTIQRDKPKLAICIYHKPEDLTDIPLYIKELVPEYRLYVRHHSNTNGETVLYAVMPKGL